MNRFNISDIYGKNIDTISIEHKSEEKNKRPLCVLGVYSNQYGKELEKEMLSWLMPEYDVYCVYQEPPGKLFEYPAIRFAQWLLNNSESDYCLYLHTKGAFNKNNLQGKIRTFWKNEFTGDNKNKYINEVSVKNPFVSTPFSSQEGHTWFNAFFANKYAFNIIGVIKENKDRYYFEDMFKEHADIVHGVLKHRVKGSGAIMGVRTYKTDIKRNHPKISKPAAITSKKKVQKIKIKHPPKFLF